KAIVITHHPAFLGLTFPTIMPPHLDQLLWKAFSGNRSLESVLEQYAEHIAVIFSGHTHCVRESMFHSVPGYNLGGDYTWKRLLRLDWPSGSITAQEFHAD